MLVLVLVAVVLMTLTNGQGNLVFDGGSISSYHVRQVNQTFMRMHLVVLTGWQLGAGPCSGKCDMKEVNYNTTTQPKQGQGTLGISHGKWTAEVGHGTTFQTTDITDYVKQNSASYVIAVNKLDGWELEVTEFDYDIDMAADYTDITLSGPKWRPYHREGTTAAPESDLQIKLQPHIRNDTGLPNGTPVTIFKPVYRVPLNQVSFIDLAPVDPDGDAVICEAAAYVSAGGIRSPANITIHKDCRIEVAAFESLGYTDNGWEAVAIVMSDYNRVPITMGDNTVLKPYFRYLSQLSIQLMIHTVKTVSGPAFINPTPADHHPFVVEVNTLLSFTLAAHGDSPIDTFHVSTLPFANVNLTSLTGETAQLSWRPTHSDVGTYAMQVRATDITGAETMERTFILHVQDREPYTLLQHPTESDFAFVPTIATFKCRDGDTCMIAVPVITSFQTESVEGEGETDLVDWQGPYVSVPGTNRYQADVRIENMTPGMHNLCLKFQSTSRAVEKVLCVNVSVTYKDPCEKIPCLHYGECVADKGQFSCNCLATYTGQLCEKVIDVCSPSPCVHGKCYNTFGGAAPFYCQCDQDFSGTKCDAGSGSVASTATATTLAATTTVSSTIPATTTTATTTTATTTTATTTPASSSVCADKPGVNCTLLDTTTSICDSPIGPKYCSDYCQMC